MTQETKSPAEQIADKLEAKLASGALSIEQVAKEAIAALRQPTISAGEPLLCGKCKEALPPSNPPGAEPFAWRRRRKGIAGDSGWIMCPLKPERDSEFELQALIAANPPGDVREKVIAELEDRVKHLVDALRPFITGGLSGTEAAKIIDKRYRGLNPIQVTVTKFQFNAAYRALAPKDAAATAVGAHQRQAEAD